MPRYAVVVRGSGILQVIDGQVTKCGFLTTRAVEAPDEREAFVEASRSVRARLEATVGVQKTIEIMLDEVSRQDDSADCVDVEPGFIWFSEG